ncbi:hypothetical protein [Alkalihalobacterium alkalinitrilicum]|uniref:hypothetical protein n=1 Tax=Alkalihalobacterium alkalinitrilicum TaxID=427920 RepID=UPI0009955CF1|nr:hypothetical protein [Alkalihalobacterium alkalinitrilicum]
MIDVYKLLSVLGKRNEIYLDIKVVLPEYAYTLADLIHFLEMGKGNIFRSRLFVIDGEVIPILKAIAIDYFENPTHYGKYEK